MLHSSPGRPLSSTAVSTGSADWKASLDGGAVYLALPGPRRLPAALAGQLRGVGACSEYRVFHQLPISFDDFRALGVDAARDAHLRSELRQRREQADHHVVEQDGFDPGQQSLLLRGLDLRQKPLDERLQHRFSYPLESRVAGRRL